jgi:hypothetical protein
VYSCVYGARGGGGGARGAGVDAGEADGAGECERRM